MKPNSPLTGKVVIITGAGRGIGRTIAAMYARCGAKVVIAEKEEKIGRQTAEDISNGAIRITHPQSLPSGAAEQSSISPEIAPLFVQTDVGESESVLRMMQEVTAQFGGVDILINNAGIGRRASPYDLSLDDWEEVIHTNLRGTFLCSREAARSMRERGGGAIVNIASTRALMSEPNTEAYAASKGGIVALTHALAVSLGSDGIRVNCISPGWIETGDYAKLRPQDHAQHPAGRVGTPEDIARACLFLTDPANGFIMGENLVIDGGMTRKMIYIE